MRRGRRSPCHTGHCAAKRRRRGAAVAAIFSDCGHRLAGRARRSEAVSRKRSAQEPRMTRPDQTTFIKALGLWDVIAMNIVAVVGLRWIARSARIGAPSVSLWILACVVFFIPLALALIELSSRHPEQGGIYAWVHRAFGPLHGFVCGWCLWVNNLFYFPSLLLFAAANFALVLGPTGEGLAESRFFSMLFVL